MTATPKPRRRPVPVVGPRLKKLLLFVFGLFALLAINAFYLGGVTFLEWRSGETFQGYFYQLMFLGHLVLGLLILAPVIVYGAVHIHNAYDRPNRRAVKAGYALFAVALVLLASGLVLTRGIPVIEIHDPEARDVAYWLHVITPFVVAWLFVLHRLAGKRIRWRAGAAVAGIAIALTAVAVLVQMQDPRRWNQAGPAEGEQYFFPSLARTATGNFIPARALMNDAYCAECHADAHDRWSWSAHRFASFNNPAYRFSVRGTRAFAMARDGNVQAARFCAGCHDLVPFFSGAFDDPNFDDVGHPTASAGITCTGCHAITHVNSPRGNADYTIEEPLHYPFAYSDEPFLKWVNRTLVKAKPAFHKKTFLKPLHESAEFCGACHKVHLPETLNGYKWLRGQNHYDSFLLSGVSGHGTSSFYYPPKAESNCNGCHMPARASTDFGARRLDDSDELKIHDHQFASANTALVEMMGLPDEALEAHRDMLVDSLRVDLFGLRRDGRIDGELLAPLGPSLPVLEPGGHYLVETVLRTLTLGHLFTQGTADSNEVWVDVTLTLNGAVIGRSGAMRPGDRTVDPWSHFVNAYVLDRDGRRIDRRNAEDIFTALYNNQIPPGAADVVHYRFALPPDASGRLEIEASLNYRKFDTNYVRLFEGERFDGNDMPVTVIDSDRVVFDVAAADASGDAGSTDHSPRVATLSSDAGSTDASPRVAQLPPTWQRWNDYGIGLLRKTGPGELRQAEAAFRAVEREGRADGPVNLARVYLREGRLDEAVDALARAAAHEPPAPPWLVTWLTAEVNRQNGFLDEAIDGYRELVETNFADARARGFDFSRDYRLLNALAATLFQRARLERGEDRQARRTALLDESLRFFAAALEIDPENTAAHYGSAQVLTSLGRDDEAAVHRDQHARYRPDDNARDRAIAAARRADPAADHAAEATVIYDLQRDGAWGITPMPASAASGRRTGEVLSQ